MFHVLWWKFLIFICIHTFQLWYQMYNNDGHSRLYLFLQVANLQQSSQSTENQNRTAQWRKNMKAIKNLMIVVVLLNICLNPYLILCLVMSSNPDYYGVRLAPLNAVFPLMLVLNSGMNPIVYAVRFRPFQVAFKLMFGCIKNEDRARAIPESSVWSLTFWDLMEILY